ncbi:hypothetical protein KAU11_11160 [Candidatus Babeliales bacterium]|nr:hypothetical protein [Candidatus Babeliales bacterium]
MAATRPDPILFKWAIKDDIIKNLYAIPLTILQKEQCQIIKENAQNHPDFDAINYESYVYYHSQRYYSKQADVEELAFDPALEYRQVELLPHMRDMLINNLDEIKELKAESVQINTYLNNIFNKANNVADIYKLLPTSAHRFINYEKGKEAISLTTQQINNYQQITYKYAEMLNQRIILNLISQE